MSGSPAVVNGAEDLVEALEALDVEIVFGLPGVHNLPIWEALRTARPRLVGVRHEQAAAYAADGYARTTGRLGVALVTSGPGAANTLAAVGEAWASGSAVLVIATDIPTRLRRDGVYRGVLHETRDQGAMFVPVTKSTRLVKAGDSIADAVRDAASLASTAPSGPVYLGVPTDLLSAAAPPPSRAAMEPTTITADPAELDRATGLLDAARRPLIWAGGGAARAGAGVAVGELATRLAAPVVTTFSARGLLPLDHPCTVTGPVHVEAVGRLWDEADVVLAVGTDFDGMMTQNWAMPAPTTLISINVDGEEADKNYPASAILVGDALRVVEELLPRLSPRGGLGQLKTRLQGIAAEVAEGIVADEPAAADFLTGMQRALPAESVVVADMCIPGYWLAGFRRVPLPRKLLYPVGWGTLGFAFPAAIGAALADRGPVVCVCGDGGFLFACGELATVREHDIPLTLIVVDDGGYGMLRFDQERDGRDRFGVDLVRPDFERLAESFDLPVTSVRGFGASFETALGEAVSFSGPRVLVVDAQLKPPPTTSPRWYRKRSTQVT